LADCDSVSDVLERLVGVIDLAKLEVYLYFRLFVVGELL
jgi:hypothetical protein